MFSSFFSEKLRYSSFAVGVGWRFTLILICLISGCVWLCLLLTWLILELTDERRGSVEREKRQVSKSEPKPQKRTITGGILDLVVVVVGGQLESRSPWTLLQLRFTYAFKSMFRFRNCIVTLLFAIRIIIRPFFFSRTSSHVTTCCVCFYKFNWVIFFFFAFNPGFS